MQFIVVKMNLAGHSGSAGYAAYCLLSLEQWDPVFESHSRCRWMLALPSCLCSPVQPEALPWADSRPKSTTSCLWDSYF
jgi:hypothetical protein